MASSEVGAATIEVRLLVMPAWAEKVLLIASADPAGRSVTFGQIGALITTVHVGDSLETVAGCDSGSAATAETAMILGELYRRNGVWRFRSVGQGFFDGLGGVIRTFGLKTD